MFSLVMITLPQRGKKPSQSCFFKISPRTNSHFPPNVILIYYANVTILLPSILLRQAKVFSFGKNLRRPPRNEWRHGWRPAFIIFDTVMPSSKLSFPPCSSPHPPPLTTIPPPVLKNQRAKPPPPPQRSAWPRRPEAKRRRAVASTPPLPQRLCHPPYVPTTSRSKKNYSNCCRHSPYSQPRRTSNIVK